MAFVNNAIAELQRSLGLTDADFFCECGSIWCTERITLTRAQYANLLEACEPVIAERHAGRRKIGFSESADDGNNRVVTA